jgi:NAD(P)-dependent dehydrogenase (short-subunit alcohol dehydrogenase family)
MSEQNKGGRLAGRIALVTGASRGIGAAVARRFAAEGAHVVLVARTVGALEEVDDQIQAAGGSATLVPLDLQEFDKIDQMGAALYERFGRLDILVGNAGHIGSLGPMSHQDPKVFKRVMETNVIANYRLIRSLEPLLKLAPAGRAVFTACAVGHEPTAYWSAYAVSKAALEMMVRTWGAELTKTNVKVALVDPGPVATQLRRTAFPGEDQSVMAQPDDVAGRFLDQVLA